MEIWPNLEKKRNTDHDFPPPFMRAENNKMLVMDYNLMLQISRITFAFIVTFHFNTYYGLFC